MTTWDTGCKTPGCVYLITVSERYVEASVSFGPRAARLYGLTEKQAAKYEDKLHDAMEAMLAEIVKEHTTLPLGHVAPSLEAESGAQELDALRSALMFAREMLEGADARLDYEPGSLGAIEMAEAFEMIEAALNGPTKPPDSSSPLGAT